MPRYATVTPQLSVEELAVRYRQAHDPVERTHWQLIWLVAQGHHVPEVAAVVGYSANWVREIVRRYNAEGPSGLIDRRQHSHGHPPLLTPALRAALAEALDGPAPDGGVWTCGKVAAWMADRLGRPVAEARGEIRAAATALTPTDRPGDYAQAMMDLGATICRPRKPECPVCPLALGCRAFASGAPERFPAPKLKRTRPHRHGVAWWIERDSSIWLVRRPAKGLLGAMAALPGPDWGEAPPSEPVIATVRHGFTHFTLDLHLVTATDPPPGDGWWQATDRLGSAGLPTLYRRAAEAGLAQQEKFAG